MQARVLELKERSVLAFLKSQSLDTHVDAAQLVIESLQNIGLHLEVIDDVLVSERMNRLDLEDRVNRCLNKELG